MRIAILATSYPSSPGDASGHFVRAEARALALQGHEVHVVAPAPWPHDPGIVAHAAGGSRLFQWPGAATRWREDPSRLASAALFGIRAARALSGIEPQKLIACWMIPSAFPLARAAPDADLEVVCHGADIRLLVALPASPRRRIVQRIAARASQVRLVSTSLRDLLLGSLDAETAASIARIAVVCPPMVDVDGMTVRPPPSRRYAVCAARLIPDKRIDLAIRAMRLTRSDLDLVVIGDGPSRTELERAGDSRVQFLGRLGRDETLGWVARATALLHTSAVDAAPTTVLEARALGVPAVSCGAGDVARWAESDPGIVLAAPRASAVAAALDGIAVNT